MSSNQDSSPRDLPISLPSVPVLSPVLNSILFGENSSGSSSSPQAPAPSSTSSPSHAASSQSSSGPSSSGSAGPSGDQSTTSHSGANAASSNPVHGASTSTVTTNDSIIGSHANTAVSSPAVSPTVGQAGFADSPSLGSSATPVSTETPPPIANIGPDPTQTIASGATSDATRHTSTSGTNSGDGSGLGNSASGSSSSPNLSKGAIAGIAVGFLFVAAVILVILVRRRFQSRRAARRLNHWQGISSSKFDFSSPKQSHDDGLMSQRSSFATTYDISSNPPRTPVEALPEFPAMAELRDSHGPGLLTHSQTVDDFVGNSMVNMDSEKYWVTSSSPTSPHLSVGPPLDGLSVNLIPPSPTSPTRMSVRPFTPSELFRFPKPPIHVAGGAVDPFADPVHIHEFNEIEIIRRPFVPSLDDEIWVEEGDKVRILRIFSDSWALVEHINDGRRANDVQSQTPGLIPIDCLRSKAVQSESV